MFWGHGDALRGPGRVPEELQKELGARILTSCCSLEVLLELCSLDSPSASQSLWKVGLSSLLRPSHRHVRFHYINVQKEMARSWPETAFKLCLWFILFILPRLNILQVPALKMWEHSFISPFVVFCFLFLACEVDMKDSLKQVIEEFVLCFQFLHFISGDNNIHLFFLIVRSKEE